MSATRKRRSDPFDGKRDVSSNLLRAVTRFVEHHGGRVVVIGGIRVEKWPDDLAMTFRLSVKYTGTCPTVLG